MLVWMLLSIPNYKSRIAERMKSCDGVKEVYSFFNPDKDKYDMLVVVNSERSIDRILNYLERESNGCMKVDILRKAD